MKKEIIVRILHKAIQLFGVLCIFAFLIILLASMLPMSSGLVDRSNAAPFGFIAMILFFVDVSLKISE